MVPAQCSISWTCDSRIVSVRWSVGLLIHTFFEMLAVFCYTAPAHPSATGFSNLLLCCFSTDLDEICGVKKGFFVLFKMAPSAIFYLCSFRSSKLPKLRVPLVPCNIDTMVFWSLKWGMREWKIAPVIRFSAPGPSVYIYGKKNAPGWCSQIDSNGDTDF